MENEKQRAAQSNLYPTAPTGDPYPPPYAAFQSPNPGVANPQAPPPHPPYPQSYPSTTPNQPYSQAGGYPSATTHQPYSQAGYPSGESGPPAYGYSSSGTTSYGQPQPMVIMSSQPQSVVIAHQPASVSMIGAIVLSCFVFWCCGFLCGLVAFILAMVGQSSSSSGNAQGAIQLRNASYGVSIAGIVFTVIVIVVIIVLRQNQSYYHH